MNLHLDGKRVSITEGIKVCPGARLSCFQTSASSRFLPDATGRIESVGAILLSARSYR